MKPNKCNNIGGGGKISNIDGEGHITKENPTTVGQMAIVAVFFLLISVVISIGSLVMINKYNSDLTQKKIIIENLEAQIATLDVQIEHKYTKISGNYVVIHNDALIELINLKQNLRNVRQIAQDALSKVNTEVTP